MISIDHTTPVILGEVLFDCFPDGLSVLGGAPFNVAWHLQGFGLAPVMVSGVGEDEHGKMVLETMRDWGMSTRGIQIDSQHPTGKVSVSLENGQPSYEIEPDQAYDHIDPSQVLSTIKAGDFSLLYHGSLLTRTSHSRSMLDTVMETAMLPSFVDINLRPPWWTTEDVNHSLSQSTWVKLNEDELLTLMKIESDSTVSLFSIAREFFDMHNLELLIVTQGVHGAFCVTADDMISGAPVEADVVDTVGAGDAFTSIIILGLTYSWPMSLALERALEFAAKICEQRGATSSNRRLYDNYLQRWEI